MTTSLKNKEKTEKRKHLMTIVADMITKEHIYDDIVNVTGLSKTTIRLYRRALEKEGLLPKKVRKGLPVEFDRQREQILKMIEEGMSPGKMLRAMGLPYNNRALAVFATWRSRKKLPNWKKKKEA